jgi:hypothetical protein
MEKENKEQACLKCLQCKSREWLCTIEAKERLCLSPDQIKYRKDSQVSLFQCDMEDCVQYKDLDYLLKNCGAWDVSWVWKDEKKHLCCSLCEQQNKNVIPFGECEGCQILLLDTDGILPLLKEGHKDHSEDEIVNYMDDEVEGALCGDCVIKVKKFCN